MDDEIVVIEQRLIDGVVVSIGVDAILLNAVKKGGVDSGRSTVEYRMRRATAEEMQDYSERIRVPVAGSDLPKDTPT